MNAMTDPRGTSLQDAPRLPPVHHAEDLTRGVGQAHIVLNGQVYTLRITRAGKLILTK